MMKNPWVRLPKRGPFVVGSDKKAVNGFNDRVKESDRLKLDLLPIPFLGNPSAPVVLLTLNPGYHPSDAKLQSALWFTKAWREALRHKGGGFPFFFLDPNVEGVAQEPAARWWERVFSRLAENPSDEWGALARTFFCIEYFPYRSHHYRSMNIILESQRYGFELARQAVSRGAVVVIMRSRRLWLKEVPELEGYKHLYVLKNPRCRTLSPANLPDGFAKINRIFVQQTKVINRFNDTRGFRVGVDAVFERIPDSEKPYLRTKRRIS